MVRHSIRTTAAAFGLWLLIALVAGLPLSIAVAHEGHDHDKAPALNLPVAPRVISVTPELELVGVASGKDRLTIFLHSFATNEPVKGARIGVSSGDQRAAAKSEGDGVFTVSAPWIGQGQAVDLVFDLTLADGSQDLLSGRLERIASAQTAAPAGQSSSATQLIAQPAVILSGLAGIAIGFLAALLVVGRRGRAIQAEHDAAAAPVDDTPLTAPAHEASVTPLRRTPGAHILVVVLTLAGAALTPLSARAADAVPAALPTVPSTMATDLAQRMPDGTLFVPKATQHLLSVRTIVVAEGETAASTEMTGTIVAAPDNLGRVQSGQPGRFEAAPGGLAYVGKHVEKGDLLGYVQTYIEASNRANIDSQIAETEARIEKNRTILSRYERSTGAVPQIKIDEVRGELEALIRKRAELLPSVAAREAIHAPVSGVVSLANVAIGQIVEARDVLFEIIDPSQFWIEAHGHSHESRRLDTITKAIAIAGTQQLPVEFVGRGLALRQQSTIYRFKISGAQNGLSVGMPVKVVVQSAAKVDGFVVPSSAIVRGQTGLPIAWVKTEPERFEPHTVNVEPLDGRNVVVTTGLKPDMRIVTDGVTLLNQVR